MIVAIAMLSLVVQAQEGLKPFDIVVTDSNGTVVSVDPVTGTQRLHAVSGLIHAPSSVAVHTDGTVLVSNYVDNDTSNLILVNRESQQQFLYQGSQIRDFVLNQSGVFVLNETRLQHIVAGTNSSRIISRDGLIHQGASLDVTDQNFVYLLDNSKAYDDLGYLLRVDPDSGAQTLVSYGGFIARPLSVTLSEGDVPVVLSQTADTLVPLISRVSPGNGEQELFAGLGLLNISREVVYHPQGYSVLTAATSDSYQPNMLVGVDHASGDQRVISFGGLLNSITDVSIFVPLVADANADGIVNIQDLSKLASNFGMGDRGWEQGDFNFDGIVNIQDLSKLASNFSKVSSSLYPTSNNPIPEPSTLVLVGLAGCALCRRPREKIARLQNIERFKDSKVL